MEHFSFNNFDGRLISAVREHEVLYNKGKTGYKNNLLRADIWRRIAIQLGSTDEICIKRWRGLRDRFVKESRKLSASGQPGSSTSQIGVNTWELYDQLRFLKNHLILKKSHVTEKDTDAGETNDMKYTLSDNDINVIPSEEIPSLKKSKKRKSSEIEGFVQYTVNALKKACEPDACSSMQIFMKSMACKLENLPLIIQNNAMIKIAKYVIKLENEHMG